MFKELTLSIADIILNNKISKEFNSFETKLKLASNLQTFLSNPYILDAVKEKTEDEIYEFAFKIIEVAINLTINK